MGGPMKRVYLKALGGISMIVMTNIHLSLMIAEVIIGIIGLRKFIPMIYKGDYDKVKNIKVRLIFYCILMALNVLHLIPRMILKRSIEISVLSIILLGICIVWDLYDLNKKIKEESTNQETTE